MFKLPENQALRAGLYMVLAMGSFVTNDTLIKVVGLLALSLWMWWPL